MMENNILTDKNIISDKEMQEILIKRNNIELYLDKIGFELNLLRKELKPTKKAFQTYKNVLKTVDSIIAIIDLELVKKFRKSISLLSREI